MLPRPRLISGCLAMLLLAFRYFAPHLFVVSLRVVCSLLLLLKNDPCLRRIRCFLLANVIVMDKRPPIAVRAARIARRIFVLIALNIGISLGSWKVGLPGVRLVGGARGVDRTLLLNERGSVEVISRRVPLLHVRDGHLGCKASV